VLACIRCHKVGNEGGDAGPSLSSIGAMHPREYLLESVVKPNAKIPDGFQNVVVTLKSGEVKAGMVSTEDDVSLTLKLADNTTVQLAKSDVGRRESAPSSMPEIFGQILTKTELRDVVEYLASLRSSGRVSPAGVATSTAPAGPVVGPTSTTMPRALRNLPAMQ
jgi:quinoprotein glucose dehydrogenase